MYLAADQAVGAGLAPPACCEFAPRCRVCTTQRLPLVTKGSCRRRRLKGSERCRFAERPPTVVRQNVHLLIPSVTASPCHRLAAARSRRGSDSPPGCHSIPRRRFAALVTKGRLGLLQIRRCDTHPCLPLWESQGASANTQKNRHRACPVPVP